MENNDGMNIAKATKTGIVDIPQNAVLVVENVFTKSIKTHPNTGVWFTLPGFYYNTIIYQTPFTKQYGEEKYDATDMPEVRVKPQITCKVTKPSVFYKQVCGRDVKQVRVDSQKLDSIFSVAKVAIRNIVTSCEFKELKTFSLVSKKINGQEKYKIKNIKQNTFDIIENEFKNIENTYGIRIIKLGFDDVTLPEMVQQAQLAAEKAKYDAQALELEAEGKKKAAQAEADAMNIKIKTYLQAGLKKEDIAKIIMMEIKKDATVIMGTNNTDALLAQFLSNQNNHQNNQNNNQNSNDHGSMSL